MIHTTGSQERAASRLIRTAVEWVALSVLSAVLPSSLAGWESLYRAPRSSGWMEPRTLPWLAGLSLLAGVVGLLYVRLCSALARLLRRGRGRTLPKAAIGSLAAA